MEDLRLQKIAYSVQKNHAKKRGIDFKLSFDEWWDIWKPHYHNRGSKKGQFCMCRIMDKGAYEVGNVTIGTIENNAHTRSIVSFDKKMKKIQESWKGFYKEHIEDDEDGWLPKELKGQLRSSFP